MTGGESRALFLRIPRGAVAADPSGIRRPVSKS